MEEQLRRKVEELIVEIRQASQGSNAPGFLHHLVQFLERIAGEFEKPNPDSEILLRGAGALGRGVTDDYAFSESPLGTKLLDFITEIVSKYDSAWPYN